MRVMIKSPAMAGAIAAIAAVLSTPVAWTAAWAQMPAAAWKTPWGEPDLQGIWTVESDTPLQRPPKCATQDFSRRNSVVGSQERYLKANPCSSISLPSPAGLTRVHPLRIGPCKSDGCAGQARA